MMRPLTKSRFKMALECPTKLYYTGKKQYDNAKEEDSFLQALAEGGFQVGELAKLCYPGGHDITESGYDEPLQRTQKLLQQENVIIYEAAIRYGNFFIRVDVLVKNGNEVKLIEVKAKSFSGGDADEFLDSKNNVSNKWSPYLEDVAFQKYVMKKAFPEWNITAYLMLADKSKKATVKGLNQMFRLVKDENGRTKVEFDGDISPDAIGDCILTAVNVDKITDWIISGTAYKEKTETSYEEKIKMWADYYSRDEKIISPVGVHCFECEFQSDDPKRSGFRECWSRQYPKWTDIEYSKPKTTDLWNFRRKKKLFDESGIIFMDELQEAHIDDKGKSLAPESPLKPKQRQWLQVQKTVKKDDSVYFDKEGMKKYMAGFRYPLHFIDFETTMVAIPFYEGQRPYEQVAFQFSHHIMYEDGKVEHAGQFIETQKGKFPNFNFLKELKKQLEKDNGTIFRYAPHENTVLNKIYDQLEASQKEDKKELMAFIESITHRKDEWKGDRDMVDMLDMVKKFFYDPQMGKSNSIKAVLPAVLNRSKFIQQKYSKPVYGKNASIKSLNYDNMVWIEKESDGTVKSPYKLLPDVFEGISNDVLDTFVTDNNRLDEGGAAMTAFARMQFTNMTQQEHKCLTNALLKYCELDTLAMVMIYEYWLDEI